MSKSRKNKLVDIGKMHWIRSSFLLLEHYSPWDDCGNPSEAYYEDLSPLITALQNKEYDLIAASLPKSNMSNMAKWKLHTRIFVNNLISKPKDVLGFEIELTKNDVIQIMDRVFKTHNKYIPTNSRTLSNWWRSIGIPLEQARGGFLDPDLEKWIEMREQRIASGEITFTPTGEPMENGKLMFLNFPFDLRASRK
jgi:hypothetical protein